jgi:hypothetical protein
MILSSGHLPHFTTLNFEAIDFCMSRVDHTGRLLSIIISRAHFNAGMFEFVFHLYSVMYLLSFWFGFPPGVWQIALSFSHYLSSIILVAS